MTNPFTKKLLIVTLPIILLAILPLILGKYWLNVLTVLAINAIVLVSFRFILNVGAWSFAHVVLMGIGSYTSGLLTVVFFRWSFWHVLLLGGLAAAFFALLISYPLLRTKGFVFFLSSFAAGEAMRQAWIRFVYPFGSFNGISPIVRPTLSGAVATKLEYYYIVLALALLSLFVLYRLEKSKMGVTMKAIALNDDLCESVGINVWGHKASAFIIGSFFAGIAGVLFAHHTVVIAPGDFSSVYMFRFVGFVLVGGITFGGSLAALAILTLITELSADIPEWVPLIYGVSIILVLLFLPEGLSSLPRRMSPLFYKITHLSRKARKQL